MAAVPNDNLSGQKHDGQRDGSFDAGIQLALERLLISPDFLFRIERDPDGIAPGTAYALSDLELASRLSFFLWASMPDRPLFEAAERGDWRCFSSRSLTPATVWAPYFFVNRSTRPSVSISFCFPVKNGWQLEQISSRTSFFVDRVFHVVPQAQRTSTS